MTDTGTTHWWHVFGGEMGTGVWATIMASESDLPPDDPKIAGGLDLPDLVDKDGEWHAAHLHSFGYEPSEEEKDALTPERFRDEHLDNHRVEGEATTPLEGGATWDDPTRPSP